MKPHPARKNVTGINAVSLPRHTSAIGLYDALIPKVVDDDTFQIRYGTQRP